MLLTPDIAGLCIASALFLTTLVLASLLLLRWRRHRFRLSLRMLMLLAAVACGTLFIGVRYIYPSIVRLKGIYMIQRAGGQVSYWEDEDKRHMSANPSRSYWHPTISVEIENDARAAGIVSQLRNIPEVKSLFCHALTDTGLREICRLQRHPSLESIDFLESRITAHGIEQMAEMEWVEGIMFNTSPIGDQELKTLNKLPHLRLLWLVEEGPSANPNRFTEAGLAAIRDLSDLQSLRLKGIAISDPMAAQLHRLTGLRSLWLIDCQISETAKNDLRAALPNCEFRIF